MVPQLPALEMDMASTDTVLPPSLCASAAGVLLLLPPPPPPKSLPWQYAPPARYMLGMKESETSFVDGGPILGSENATMPQVSP